MLKILQNYVFLFLANEKNSFFPPTYSTLVFELYTLVILKKKCIKQLILYINIYNIHQIESTKKCLKSPHITKLIR